MLEGFGAAPFRFLVGEETVDEVAKGAGIIAEGETALVEPIEGLFDRKAGLGRSLAVAGELDALHRSDMIAGVGGVLAHLHREGICIGLFREVTGGPRAGGRVGIGHPPREGARAGLDSRNDDILHSLSSSQ